MKASFGSAALLGAAALALAGCGGAPAAKKMETVAVTGKVTFKGAPVAEGVINFESRTSGKSSSGEIGADGSYKVDAPAGEMVVTISPPTEKIPQTEKSQAREEVKNMPNIPEVYRSLLTSPLKAAVSEASKTHNFDMADQPAGRK